MRILLKLVLASVALASLTWITGAYAIRASRAALEGSIEASAAKLATEVIDEIDRALHGRAQQWQVYGRTPRVQEVLAASNRRFETLRDREAQIAEADRAWSASGPGERTPLMSELIDNPLSAELRAQLDALERLSGYPVYGEVFITNRYGVNAAQTGRTSDYRQDDEEWWKRARDDGVYIADVEYDESAGVFSTDVCVRVTDEVGRFMGVIKAVLNIQEVAQILTARARTTVTETAGRPNLQPHLALLTSAGRVIQSSDDRLRPLSDGSDLLAGLWPSGATRQSTRQRFDPERGFEVLSAGSISRGHAGFPGLGWVVVVDYEAANVLAPAHELRNRILLAAIGVTVLAILIGVALAGSISRRIRALRQGMLEIGQGNLDSVVETDASDELGELAVCLNRLASDLKHARGAAEQADCAKTQFLANVSHEIRTPMTVVLGHADMLLDSTLSNYERDEQIRLIRKSGLQLLSLIDDVLDLSRIESGGLEVSRGPTSPVEVIRDVVELLLSAAAAKGIDLQAEFPAPLPREVHTDSTRLRQILVNLVSNAIKFTVTGGVRLVTRIVDDAPGGPALQIEVIDTGIGMSADQINLLFRPFHQADASPTRRFRGTGLGLAISRQLAELLGGGITVASAPDMGSCFCVRVDAGSLEGVPRAEAAEDFAALEDPEDPDTLVMTQLNGRILVAEDDPAIQRLLTSVLQKAGAEVVLAVNGEEAVEKALEASALGRPFSLILMDLMMPEVDGLAATRRLRSNGHRCPIIALTADALGETRAKCFAAGCNEQLTKPFRPARLVETAARYMGSGGAA
jgi:signal transduction histidine kinase/ActR/RegA family two-component response regulator